jgi:hypothetical protein
MLQADGDRFGFLSACANGVQIIGPASTTPVISPIPQYKGRGLSNIDNG